MAKWIYEKWQPAWVKPEYASTTRGRGTDAYLVNYNLTVVPEARRVDSLNVGDIFLLSPTGSAYQYLSALSVYNQPSYVSRISYPTGVIPSAYRKAHLSTLVAEEGTYPDDGIHADNYWYVKVKPAGVGWVYEQWTSKWPDTPGESYTVSARVTVTVVSYDGTLQDSGWFEELDEGRVFYWNGGRSNPEGCYRKTESNRAVYLGTDPPLPIKDTLVDTFEAADGFFPDDGVHSDQMYYVKVKPVFPTMRILRDGQWAEAEAGFVLKDGMWKPIVGVYKLQDGQWVQA